MSSASNSNSHALTQLLPFSWFGEKAELLKISSTGSGDSIAEMWGLIGRDKSPSNSRRSSYCHKASSVYLMGKSTESAGGDGDNGATYHKSGLLRKNSSKTSLPHNQLMDDLIKLSQDYSKYRLIIDTIKSEYEESKMYEVVRRYNKLKSMIKRTVMYTKLGTLPDISCALGLGGLVMLNTGVNRWQGLDELCETPKSEIPDRISYLRRRISLVKHQIESLSDNYESSKRYAVFQRYRLLKSMVKELLTNCEETS